MDYYKQLGVKDTASDEEIAKAYRKLALKYHPDKSRESNAEERMRALNEAYKVLKDERKREHYDRFDLPQIRSEDRRGSQNYRQTGGSTSSTGRHRRDDSFFTGSSKRFSAEQRYKSTLEEIQRINSETLDAVNAQRRRAHHTGSRHSSSRRGASYSNKFVGEIMPDKPDDEYEKIVLERFRAISRNFQ